MSPPAFDPTAPLPAPPDPWAAAGRPSARFAPPFHMTDMIAAEPHLARRLLARLAAPDSAAARLAGAIREAAKAGRPIVLTGCGTSEHAAQGAVDILRPALRAGLGAVTSAQAFELALDPPADALVIGISHEGGTTATNRALEASRAAGSATALVTASGASPAAALADTVLATGELDQSWCHTIGYVAPLLAVFAAAAHLTDTPPDADAAARLLVEGAADEAGAEAIAAGLADVHRLLVIASGADRPAGRELVLKVEEGSWLRAAYRDLETFLHGHLPATDARTGLVLILTDPEARAARGQRARQALAAAREIGIRASAILGPGIDSDLAAELTPLGRLVVPEAPELPAPVAALLGSAAALQLLAERLARARGTNPDLMRREDPRYEAATAAGRFEGR